VIEYVPIDKYWHQVLSTVTSTGVPQYLILIKLVKCLLSLSHGNSDVERDFSQNNNLISDDRSLLNESSIKGLRATNGGIQFFGNDKTHLVSIPLIYSKNCNSVFKIPTTPTLLSNVQEAYSRYAKDLEQQQKLITNINVLNEKPAADVEREQLQE
jgi:hypothetical protein